MHSIFVSCWKYSSRSKNMYALVVMPQRSAARWKGIYFIFALFPIIQQFYYTRIHKLNQGTLLDFYMGAVESTEAYE